MSFNFDNSYSRLPEQMFSRIKPVPVGNPELVHFNSSLALEMGLDAADLTSRHGIEILAGNRVPPGAAPLAAAYGGHQFGNWAGQLGDGRAVLLGEVVGSTGKRWDLQLKGSGRTPYSRSGDGRAVLGAVLREYIVSEAMAALGIPTTRALAVVSTGETVMRERPLPGAVLTRVAASHIRVGTFELFAANGDQEALKALLDHTIERHYLDVAEAENPALELLRTVLKQQVNLIVKWMSVGFIHGVMNTDNMTLSGETIDYGPCAFMDTFHPAKKFSSIDQAGRYAWGNQPSIAIWNLSSLAGALIPLIDTDQKKAISQAEEVLNTFNSLFTEMYHQKFMQKIGLSPNVKQGPVLVNELLEMMAGNAVDFTLFFRRLTFDGVANDGSAAKLFAARKDYQAWAEKWRKALLHPGHSAVEIKKRMKAVNPVYIPRNHRVEAAISAAYAGDNDTAKELISVLAQPFEERERFAEYESPPEPEEVVQATFCGT